MNHTLITAGIVLPVSSKPISKGAVLIAEGKIRAVGKERELKRKYGGAGAMNLGRGVLLPGLVNAHAHLELGWIKQNIGYFGGFIGWIQQIIKAKRTEVSTQEIQSSVRAGVEALIKSGVTTVGEISSFEGLDKHILKASGLRTVLFSEVVERSNEAWRSLPLEKSELYEERLFPHAPYSCSPSLLRDISEFSRERAIPTAIHLAESREEVRLLRREPNGFETKVFPMIERPITVPESHSSPYRYLENLGFFDGTKSTLVHAVHVSPEELRDIAQRDVGVVLCPRSNFFLKVGEPPVRHIARLKRVGIGTDGLSSNYNLDMLEEMRFLHLISAKRLNQDAAYFTVYAATLGGARALFIEDRTGSIEVGKEADLIFLDTLFPSKDPYHSVISSDRGDVKLVMVRGEIIYSRKQHHKSSA